MNHSDRLPKIPHAAIIRAPGLLPMLYKISEVAEELQVSEDQIRYWMAEGMPFEHDETGHLWIDGEALQNWIRTLQDRRKARKMGGGQAFCFKCDRAVEFRSLAQNRYGNQVLQSGLCPHCGTKINRGGKHESQPG
jgi:transposase-like protein